MSQSMSAHNQHLSRLHHHRNRVATIRAAIDTATSDLVAEHYAQRRAAGSESATTYPPTGSGSQSPPPVQQSASGPSGAGNEVPSE